MKKISLSKKSMGAIFVSIVVLAVIGVSASVQGALTCTINFDNDNGTFAWEEAANWQGDVLPGSSDVACIPSLAQPVVYSTGTTSVVGLVSSGDFTVSGGTLNLTDSANPSTVAGVLKVNGGTLGGGADVDVSGNLVFEGGVIRGTRTVATTGTSDIVLQTTAAKSTTDGVTLESADEVNWTGGSLSMANSGDTLIAPTALNADLATSAVLGASGARGNLTTPQFNKTGAGTLRVYSRYQNTGSTDVDGGQLILHGNSGVPAHTGSFTGDASLTFQDPNHAFDVSTVINLFSLEFIQVGTPTIPVNVTVTDLLRINKFSGTSSPIFDGEVSAGNLQVQGSSTGVDPVFNGPVTVADLVRTQTAGNAIFNNTLIANRLIVQGSEIGPKPSMAINNTANITTSAAVEISTLTGTGTVNAPTFIMDGSTIITYNTYLDEVTVNTGTFTFGKGTHNFTNGAEVNADVMSTDIFHNSFARALTSDGSANKITTGELFYHVTSDTEVAVPIEIDGPADISNSNLTLSGGSGGGAHSGTWNVETGRTLALSGEHDFENPGIINGGSLALVNSQVTLPRDVNVEDFSVDAGSSLTADVDGSSGGLNYDQVSASGTATVDGTLNVNTGGSYSPANGSQHDVVNGATLAGTFGTVNGLTGQPWGEWVLSYEPTAVRLTADSNVPPTANDSSESVDEDNVLNSNVTADDDDGDTLTFAVVDQPTNGTLDFNADGTYTYTPDANFNGLDGFTFEANDGEETSNTATVTITVNPVNDDPVADDDSFATDEDTPLAATLSASDVDGDSLDFSVVSQASNGTVVLSANGDFTYYPDSNYSGIDAFTFKVNDGTVDSNVATVTITVNPVNDAPVAQDANESTDEDVVLNSSVTASDAENDALTFSVIDQPANGTLAFNGDGTYSYTPNANYNGSDSFTIKANDGQADSNVATVSIDVGEVNDAPLANDSNETTQEDTDLNSSVTASDVEGDTLTYSVVDEPSHGSLTLNGDGSYSYTPDADFNGNDSFTFKANDGTDDSNTATVNITVEAVNDAPVAQDSSEATEEDTALDGSVNATDVDGDTLTYSAVDQPANGTLTLNGDGTFEYVPNANFNGGDSFTFLANDENADSNTATISISINPVNDAPVATADMYTITEGFELNVSEPGVLENDTDTENDTLTTVLVTTASNGTLSLNPNGSFNYTPNSGFVGQDQFTYKASDESAESSETVVNIDVTEAAPEFTARILQPINEDGTSVFKKWNLFIPVRWELFDSEGEKTCELPDATIKLTRIGEAGDEVINEDEYDGFFDVGPNYRKFNCKYFYNLRTWNLQKGEYKVEIIIDGDSVGQASFKLK